MVVYLDASALVKLVVEEPESTRLRRYLRRHETAVSSALARVELLRAVRRYDHRHLGLATEVIDELTLLALDEPTLEAAASLSPRHLGSLDAIHVAAATGLGDELDALITYDERMAAAASVLSLPVEAPA